MCEENTEITNESSTEKPLQCGMYYMEKKPLLSLKNIVQYFICSFFFETYRLFLHIAIRRGSKHSRTIIIAGQSLTAEVSLSSSIKGKYPISSQIGVRLKDFAHLIPLLHSTIYFWIMSNLFYLQMT